MGLCQPTRCGCAIHSRSLRTTGNGTTANPYLLDTWYQIAAPSSRYLTPAVGTASTPDPGPVPPAGFTICAKVRKTVLDTATVATIAGQGDATPNYSWQLHIYNGALQWRISNNGTFPGVGGGDTTVLTAAQLDTVMDSDDDIELASTFRTTGSAVEHRGYHRPPGGSWTAVAALTTSAFTGTLFDSTANVRIGKDTSNDRWDGRIYYVELRTGLDPAAGTVQWRYDSDDHPGSGTAYTDPRGDDWYLDTAAVSPLDVDAVHGIQAYLPTPNRIQRHDGAAWITELAGLTAYTPTYYNVTLGTGAVNLAGYTITNQVITVYGHVILGTGGAVTGAGIGATLPPGLYPDFAAIVPFYGQPGVRQVGNAAYYDNSGGVIYRGSVDTNMVTPTIVNLYAAAPATYPITSTNPFTWATSDEIWWKVTYDLAPAITPVTPPPPKIIARWDRTNWDNSVWA